MSRTSTILRMCTIFACILDNNAQIIGSANNKKNDAQLVQQENEHHHNNIRIRKAPKTHDNRKPVST